MDNIPLEINLTPCVPITLVQGVTFGPWPIAYTDELGNPVNLTTYSAKMQVRQTIGATGTALIALTSGTGGIVMGTGGLTVTIVPTLIPILPLEFEGDYDIVLYDNTGIAVEKLIRGPVYYEGTATQ